MHPDLIESPVVAAAIQPGFQLQVADPLQIKADVSSDGKTVTLSWKKFRQTGFEPGGITIITGPADGGRTTTWYSDNGESSSWSSAEDLRNRQPPSEILFRTRLQDGRTSPGFKVVIP